MDALKKKLLVEQVDKKLALLKPLESVVVPPNGWIHTVRIALNMSLRQLGDRLKISAQGAKEIEKREANGSISLKRLREVGTALDLKLVYGFVSNGQGIDEMIEKRAFEIAKDIVLRTSLTMLIEDQENSEERIMRAIKNRAEVIKTKMPKYLWD